MIDFPLEIKPTNQSQRATIILLRSEGRKEKEEMSLKRHLKPFIQEISQTSLLLLKYSPQRLLFHLALQKQDLELIGVIFVRISMKFGRVMIQDS